MACRTSGKAMSLNTLARSSPYSLLSTSTILALTSPPITPTRRPFNLSMPSMVEPGGATMRTTTWLTTTTARACDRSPTSPRTTARSALPAENALAASSAATVDDLQPHRRVGLDQPVRDGRHCLGSLAVNRAHRDAQRYRTRIVPIGEQACA